MTGNSHHEFHPANWKELGTTSQESFQLVLRFRTPLGGNVYAVRDSCQASSYFLTCILQRESVHQSNEDRVILNAV